MSNNKTLRVKPELAILMIFFFFFFFFFSVSTTLFGQRASPIYKENKSVYLYNSGRLYLTYRNDLSPKYKERDWMAITAMVLRPFSVSSTIDALNGGPLIKNILPTSELEFIKNNSVDGEIYNFMLILLNFNSKAIQFVPVNFTYKTKI